jgi:hypothetical protein
LVFDAKGRAWLVFENKVLRRIFGPKRMEVVGERRRLHYEEILKLYVSPYNSFF